MRNSDYVLLSLLNTGYAEIKMLNKIKFDVADIIEECESTNQEISWSTIMALAIYRGIHDLNSNIQMRISDLEDEDVEGNEEIIDTLKDLDPYHDIGYYLDGVASHTYITENEELYHLYFQDFLDEFEDNTGFHLG